MPNDDHTPATRKDLREWEIRIDDKLQQLESRLVQHFNIVAENLVHDFKGVFKDRLGQHEDRLTRLEEFAGFRRA